MPDHDANRGKRQATATWAPEDQPYADFLLALQQAPNETAVRELFVILAAKGFGDDAFATIMALGAEYAVAFSRRGLIRRGRIDSFVDNVLVEFKTTIASAADREAAREQLAGYIAGAWAEDKSYRRPYLAVAADGRTWDVYSALPVDSTVPAQSASPENISLTLAETWPQLGDQSHPSSLRRFLNRTFFRHTLLAPTSDNFARDFGLDSPVFLTISQVLARKAKELSATSQMQLYETSWLADLQVAYGNLENTGDLFIRHTYLAILARLLVWATLERRPAEPQDLRSVFDHTYFIGKRIGNLAEDDYFAWHLLPATTNLNPAWTALVAQLATYQLDQVREDILKPLYETLIDPEMRHDLGEYYTPDWLATAIVERLVDDWDPSTRGLPIMLDPACGSGSFLRAAVHRLRETQDKETSSSARLRAIVGHVHGMDVHPLAVIISRATYLLSIADLIPYATNVVNLPVYLCNSLSGERIHHTTSLLGDLVNLEVGQGPSRKLFPVPEEFVTDGAVYDYAIGEVVDIARSIGKSRTAARHVADAVRFRLASRFSDIPQSDILINSLANMGVHIAELVKTGDDSIYGFLLRNRYRSVLLRDHFDLIVGNPPWLTIADIEAGDYRELLLKRNTELNMAPRGAGEQAHTEIATVFLAQVATQFLRHHEEFDKRLRLGFVLPRSVFNATHHRRLREGSYNSRIDVAELWDLDRVTPLFNIPSCVLFIARRAPVPQAVKPGRVYSGNLRSRDPDAAVARSYLHVNDTAFLLRRLGRRSAWGLITPEENETTDTRSAMASRLRDLALADKLPQQPYASRFRQGAILYPQVLVIVDQIGASSLVTSGSVAVRTSEVAAATAKLLKSLRWQRVVDAETLLFTAVADHLVPFGVREPLWTVILPVTTKPEDPEFAPVSADTLRSRGLVLTADWLDEAELHWESVRKISERSSLWQRLDHLGQLSAQAGRGRYVVIFPSSPGVRMSAAVIDTKALERPFVVRDKIYWTSTDDIAEAHYLLSFLNSSYADGLVSDFVTRGLLGKRDSHKRILDVPWPSWDPVNRDHMELAQLGAEAVSQVRALLPGLSERVGQARTEVRRSLDPERTAAIEELTAAISTNSL